MQVIINGELKSLKSSTTVSDIISNLNIEGKIAVEVNKEILPVVFDWPAKRKVSLINIRFVMATY